MIGIVYLNDACVLQCKSVVVPLAAPTAMVKTIVSCEDRAHIGRCNIKALAYSFVAVYWCWRLGC
jgi:hypothetical protein